MKKSANYLIITIMFGLYPICSCMSQDTIKIMPLGNSITEGIIDGTLPNEYLRGYRYGLRYMLKNNSYVTDFVGSQSNGSAYFNDHQHAGIGGTRDQYLVRLLTDGYDERNGIQILVPPRYYLDEYDPDVILLHIGTNDITHEGSEALVNQKISMILDMVDQYEIRADKEVIVFLALIINRVKPWPVGSKGAITSSFNNGIKSMALNRIAAGDKLVIVDMEKDAGFEYSIGVDLAPDGLHPNEEGYNKMAALWFSSFTENYNTRPVISNIPDIHFNEGESSTIVLDDFVTDKESTDNEIIWSAEQIGTENLTITINEVRQVLIEAKNPDWFGTQTILFTATDLGNNGKYAKSSSDTIQVLVSAVNNPPVIMSIPESKALVGGTFSYAFSAIDNDGDEVSYSAITLPDWLSFSETLGLLEGAPGEEDCGLNLVRLRASDGLSFSEQEFSITVDNTSSTDRNSMEGFILYPVPAQNYLLINPGNFTGEIFAEIVNSVGIIVQSENHFVSGNEYKISLKNLKNGIYILRLKSQFDVYGLKFVIEN